MGVRLWWTRQFFAWGPVIYAAPRKLTMHLFVLVVLMISVVGFLGYYDGVGFVSLPAGIVLVLQIGFLLGACACFPSRLLKFKPGLLPLFTLAGWSALTLLWAGDFDSTLRRWLLVFVPSVMLAHIASADDFPERSFTWLKWLFVSIALGSFGFSLVVWFFGEPRAIGELLRFRVIDFGGWQVGVSEGGRQYLELGIYIPRFSGITSNPNSSALFASLAAIALCATFRWRRTKLNYFEILIFALIVFGVLLSASRASIAMLFAGLLVVLLLRLDCRVLARLCIVGALGFACLLYLATWLGGGTPAVPGEELFSLRERADVWRLALVSIQDVWTHGVGFGLTQEVVYEPIGLESSAHSVPLSTLIETGVVGLVLLLVTWFFPVLFFTSEGRRLDGMSIAISALLVSLFVHQATDSSLFRYHWLHFVFVYLIGVSCCLRRQGDRNSEYDMTTGA